MSKSNFLNVSICSPDLALAQIDNNIEVHKEAIKEAWQRNNSVILFPELSLTGVTCGDLFLNQNFLARAKEALYEIAMFSDQFPGILISIGLPFKYQNRVFNAAALILSGEILQIVPKGKLRDEDIWQETRYFSTIEYREVVSVIDSSSFYQISNLPITLTDEDSSVTVGVVVGSDLSNNSNLINNLANDGSEVILNPNIEASVVGLENLAVEDAIALSRMHKFAIVSSFSGNFESSSQYVFTAKTAVAELGELVVLENVDELRASLSTETIINLSAIRHLSDPKSGGLTELATFNEFDFGEADLSRRKHFVYPFIKRDNIYFLEDENLYKEIAQARNLIHLQGLGLARRIRQIGAQTILIGVSGGLDSTHALLVCLEAAKLLDFSNEQVMAVTMPGFGSSSETKGNATRLLDALHLENHEISIIPASLQHFEDIGHDPEELDITYENSQARERTQILMDLSNKHNGLVVGTGDLSENALGWSTYNGDQMSMYAVNASIPKTTMRYTLNLIAADLRNNGNDELSDILLDIVETPVSPELLPTDEAGEIKQRTEDQIGSYTLHDFFLYHYIYRGNSIEDTYNLAVEVLSNPNDSGEIYSSEEIHRVFGIFLNRLYKQQFKRKAYPDAVKVTPLSLDASGDFQIPSDLNSSMFLDEWKKIL